MKKGGSLGSVCWEEFQHFEMKASAEGYSKDETLRVVRSPRVETSCEIPHMHRSSNKKHARCRACRKFGVTTNAESAEVDAH